MLARYLDTQTSTFQTPDTYLGNIYNPASLNRYAYAFGNPLKYSDPTGHFNLFGAISSFASGVVQGAKKVVSAVVNTVKTVVKNVVNVITSTVSNLFNKAKDTAQEIYNAAKKGPGGVISYAKQKVETFQQKAVAAAQKRYQQVREAIYKFSCGSAQYIKSATDAVGNVMASVDWSAVGHTALDIAGMAPVVGTAFDVVNGVWYAAEGNYIDAAMSLASAIPVVGDALCAGKVAAKVGGTILSAGAMKGTITGTGIFSGVISTANIAETKIGSALQIYDYQEKSKLAANLIAVGADKPKNYASAAHHIVAQGSKNEHAQLSREILEEFDININNAGNGVWLPTEIGAGAGVYHPSVHTNDYYKEIYSRLSQLDTREEALFELAKIRKELLEYSFGG